MFDDREIGTFVQGTTRYFEAVVRTLGTSVDKFAKLFMVPGMAHCSGGPGPNRFGLGPVQRGRYRLVLLVNGRVAARVRFRERF